MGDSASSGAQASARAQQDVAVRQDVEGKIDARAVIQLLLQAALQGQQQGGQSRDGAATATGGEQDLKIDTLIKLLKEVQDQEVAETQPSPAEG